jgi:hypothetical protein
VPALTGRATVELRSKQVAESQASCEPSQVSRMVMVVEKLESTCPQVAMIAVPSSLGE